MEDLDNKWILLQNEVDCRQKDDNSPATLGLKNMRGVFILVGVGIVICLGLIVIEIIYKKHQLRKQKRMSVARSAIRRWRGAVEVNEEEDFAAKHCGGPLAKFRKFTNEIFRVL